MLDQQNNLKFRKYIEKEKDIKYKYFLSFLRNLYSKISNEVEFIETSFKKKSHYLELSIEKSFFFEISVAKKNIHIIINSFERMFFFDDKDFVDNYQYIIESLFKGMYKIISYKQNNGKLIHIELKFDDEKLKIFNQKNNMQIFNLNNKQFEISYINGVNLLK